MENRLGNIIDEIFNAKTEEKEDHPIAVMLRHYDKQMRKNVKAGQSVLKEIDELETDIDRRDIELEKLNKEIAELKEKLKPKKK